MIGNTMQELRTVPLSSLRMSPFNPRVTRPTEQIDRLAQRIQRNGFEATRALWIHPEQDGYGVFAGGTRLEAAKRAGIKEIPCFVFQGISDEEIVRLATQDNENDEYHATVPLLDVWAEYHRLNREMGWTQQRIADVKGCSQPEVARRIRMHESLCKAACKAVCDGLFDEGHAVEVMGVVCDIAYLHPWLTTTQAQTELVAEVLGKHRGSSMGIKPTVKNVRDAAARWKALIASAEKAISGIPVEYHSEFVTLLGKSKARSVPEVDRAKATVLEKIQKAKEDEAKRLREEADLLSEEQKKLNEEKQRIERISAVLSKIVHGDAREAIKNCPMGFHLLLTDPPYGMDFQSGRRTTSAKKNKIANDGTQEALSLLRDILTTSFERMADDSHALVFTGWRLEPEFRKIIEEAGFTIRGSLVWVKNNHGAGDLDGSFAPKHERIIHAVKGNPKLTTRIPDVLSGKDKQNSEHPTEKPRELLQQLIEATTAPGHTVVDPFAGSGNTVLESLALERDFFAVEIDNEFYRKITEAVHAALNEGSP